MKNNRISPDIDAFVIYRNPDDLSQYKYIAYRFDHDDKDPAAVFDRPPFAKGVDIASVRSAIKTVAPEAEAPMLVFPEDHQGVIGKPWEMWFAPRNPEAAA
jgi:hypothetical protein